MAHNADPICVVLTSVQHGVTNMHASALLVEVVRVSDRSSRVSFVEMMMMIRLLLLQRRRVKHKSRRKVFGEMGVSNSVLRADERTVVHAAPPVTRGCCTASSLTDRDIPFQLTHHHQRRQ